MATVFPTKVLLATDGSPDAAFATRSAIELCDRTGSELHLVHVGEFVPMYLAYTDEEPAALQDNARRLLDAEAHNARDAGGKVSDTHLRLGRPAEQIVGLAEELDVGVIVVGSRGLGALKRAVLGTVAESVVRHAHCPVFVARPDGRAEGRAAR